jgi:hypothetical protein
VPPVSTHRRRARVAARTAGQVCWLANTGQAVCRPGDVGTWPPGHPPQHAGLVFFSVEALSSDTTILTPSPGLLGLSSLASDFLDTCVHTSGVMM